MSVMLAPNGRRPPETGGYFKLLQRPFPYKRRVHTVFINITTITRELKGVSEHQAIFCTYTQGFAHRTEKAYLHYERIESSVMF